MRRSPLLVAAFALFAGCGSEPAPKEPPPPARPATPPPEPTPAPAKAKSEEVVMRGSSKPRPAAERHGPDKAKIAELERKAKDTRGRNERPPTETGPATPSEASAPAKPDAKKSSRPARLNVGELAPDLAVTDWPGGAAVKLDDLSGKVVLLVFVDHRTQVFRQRALPRLKLAHENFAAKGLVIVAIQMKEGSADAAAFVQASGLKFAVGIDGEGTTARAYGFAITPSYVLVDRDGIVKLVEGAFPGEAIEKELGP